MMRKILLLMLLVSIASAANLGDSPDFLMNSIGINLITLSGGAGAAGALAFGLIIFTIMAYLALSYRLDRGALVFLGFMVIGTMIQLNALPNEVWWGLVLVAAALAGYGALNALRQGAY